MMHNALQWVKRIIRKSLARDRAHEPRMAALSKYLWPWRESRLLLLIGLLSVLDYVSTYAVLALSGKNNVYEHGPLASWALQRGGFTGLFLIDLGAVSTLVLTAILVQRFLSRFGFDGFGRMGFVLVLVPYVVIAMAAVYNNIVLTFL